MKTTSNILGTYLRACREKSTLSLRDVEKAIGISNAYLSQLESGRIKQPSPTILHQLSQLFSISYAEVMQLAGYPVPDNARLPEYRLDAFGPLSQEEQEALEDYLLFIRSKKRRRGKR